MRGAGEQSIHKLTQSAQLPQSRICARIALMESHDIRRNDARFKRRPNDINTPINLACTEIHSPVNDWVTNQLAQLGDYANVKQNRISLFDTDSFGSTAISKKPISVNRVGDLASVKL